MTARQRTEHITAFGREAALWVAKRRGLGSYDRVLVDRLERHLGRRLLEVGCGVGTMTRYLCERELLVAVDLSEESIKSVRQALGRRPNLVALSLDITNPGDVLASYGLDSAICSNVLEHVKDDELALRQIAAALPIDGRLVVVVPALPWLYGSLDVAAGHYRRYALPDLREKLGRAGFVALAIEWVNVVGILGWLLNGSILRRTSIPDWQIGLFDVIARPLIVAESRLRIRFGLSLVAVCEKRPAAI